MMAPPPQPTAAAAQAAAALGAIRTIYVEHSEYSIIRLLELNLARWGYRVLTPASPPELLPELVPELAILNPTRLEQRLPELVVINPRISVWVVSGGEVRKDRLEAMGGDYFVPSPFNFIEVAARLRALSQQLFATPRPMRRVHSLPVECSFQPLAGEPPRRLVDQFSERAFEERRARLVRDQAGEIWLINKGRKLRPGEAANFVWEIRNDPTREFVAASLGRAIGVNTCEVLFPKERAALAKFVGAVAEDIYLVKVSTSYSVADADVPAKTPNAAFTGNLIFAIWIRWHDCHIGNFGAVADADLPMSFDREQAFFPGHVDMKTFVRAFAANYWLLENGFSPIYPHLLVGRLDLAELSRTVNAIETLPLGPLREEILQATSSDAKQYLEFAAARRHTLRRDVEAFFKGIYDYNQRFSATQVGMPIPAPSIPFERIREAIWAKPPPAD